MFVVKRSQHNPIILPVREHPWEAFATFNWSIVTEGDKTHALYRAMSFPELLGDYKKSISTISHAVSTDGEHFDERHQLISPENDWEKYGCEDPRVTKIDDTYYIFYTALSTFPFSPDGIKVAVALSKDLKTIDERHLVTPFNAKAMTLFPERINGKLTAILTANSDRPPSHMAIAQFDSPEQMWSPEFWDEWYKSISIHTIDDPRRNTSDHIEVGASPIKTDEGWMFIYSHMQGYFTGKTVFGIEALLLDLENPKKIVGRTNGPMLVPITLYEKNGNVPNVTFPSGAIVRDGILELYYGAADTSCCMARVDLDDLLIAMQPEKAAKRLQRAPNNPVLTPRQDRTWEAKAVFNPAAIELGGKIHILYRAMSHDNTSVIGYASTTDGINIDEILDEPVYVPRESFETKMSPGNSGCEDARLVQVEDTIYMFYTAFNGVDSPRVAVSSIKANKFLEHEWEWSKPSIITPPGIMDKDTAILPEKVKDKYMLIHRIGEVVCMDLLDSLDFENEKVTKCIQMFGPRPGMWDGKKVGISAPPIKTEKGWLMLYHGVSETSSYRVGAVLLDFDDPSTVLARTTAPILEPVEEYEKKGQVPNVVFPCGAVLKDGTLFIYYGGGDSTVAVATMKLDDLMDILTLDGNAQ